MRSHRRSGGHRHRREEEIVRRSSPELSSLSHQLPSSSSLSSTSSSLVFCHTEDDQCLRSTSSPQHSSLFPSIISPWSSPSSSSSSSANSSAATITNTTSSYFSWRSSRNSGNSGHQHLPRPASAALVSLLGSNITLCLFFLLLIASHLVITSSQAEKVSRCLLLFFSPISFSNLCS